MYIKVINSGCSYSGYISWARFYNLNNFMCYKELHVFLITNSNKFKIVVEGVHFGSGEHLYGIQHENGYQFIVDKEATELLSDNNGNYLLGF